MAASGISKMEQTPSAATKLTLLQQIVRYAIHLIVLYEIVGFSTNLPGLIYPTAHWLTRGFILTPQRMIVVTFAHPFASSVIPAFVAGLIINAKFRHKAAEYIWIVPVTFLVYAFLLHGPGIYPTMLGDSDFPKAFHYFFGGGLPTDVTSVNPNWTRVILQLCFTMPAYGAIAYSLGAFLGMNRRARALQQFMEKF